jgi:glycosyltransferase involved in cell wall biosynthesis
MFVSLTGTGKYGPLISQTGARVTVLGMRNGKLSFLGLWQLYSQLRHEKPEALQTWMYHANLIAGVLARLAGVKNIVWGIRHTDFKPGVSKQSVIVIARLCARLSHWIPSHIVVCAKKAAEVHVKMGYPEEKMRFIPNGFDLTKLYPDNDGSKSLRAELKLPGDWPVVGLIARYDPQKDHQNLLEAVARVRQLGLPIVLLLVGSKVDPDNAQLVDLVATNGLQDCAHLLGQRDDVRSLMSLFDLHVLSSAYGEAFPNVIAEAMSCGTPCISTDVGDARTIIGETGWVVPSEDHEALADAIYIALSEMTLDSDHWLERQATCRQRIVETFQIENMVESYHSIWFDTGDTSYSSMRNFAG